MRSRVGRSSHAHGTRLRDRKSEGRGGEDHHHREPRRLHRRVGAADARRRPRPAVQRDRRRSAWTARRARPPTTASAATARSPRRPGPAGPDNLWVVPANRDLAGAAVELPALERFQYRLREGLGPVRERFAATLLDCPPSLGPVTVNALVAADRAIVPVQAEYLALEGLVQFLDTLQSVRRELNPALILTGLLITMADDRTRLPQDVERRVERPLSRAGARDGDPAQRAASPRRRATACPVTEHAPHSRGSRWPTAPWPRRCWPVASRSAGIGRGLAAILPEATSVGGPSSCARRAGRADQAEPGPAAQDASTPTRSSGSPPRSPRRA